MSFKKPIIPITNLESFKVRISQIPPFDVAFKEMALTDYEMLVATIYRLNELIKINQEYIDLTVEVLEWVMNDGLSLAVLERLTEWKDDGTLDQLINDLLFNSKLDKTEFEDFKIQLNQTLEDLETNLTQDMNDLDNKISGDMNDLDNKISGDMSNLDKKISDDMSELDNKLTGDMSELDNKLTGDMSELDNKLTGDMIELENGLNSYFISVKSYGAIGDGVTDDTEAIQLCINENEKVFFPSGTYIITKPLKLRSYQTIQGLNAGVSRLDRVDKGLSRIVKRGNLTRNDLGIHSNYNVNMDTIDSIFLTNTYEGDITIKNINLHSENENSKSQYAIYMPKSYRLAIENVYIINFINGIELISTWNNNFKRVRMRGIENTGWKIGSNDFNMPQSTSCDFSNCFVEDANFGFHFINLTYSSGNSIAADFIKECAYWFEYTTFSANGVGNEYSDGQVVRVWLSNVTFNGLFILGIRNYRTENKPLYAKSYAKFESYSENRSTVGLIVNSGEIRGRDGGDGKSDYYSCIGGTSIYLNNFRDTVMTSSSSGLTVVTKKSDGYIRDGVDISTNPGSIKYNRLTQIQSNGSWINDVVINDVL